MATPSPQLRGQAWSGRAACALLGAYVVLAVLGVTRHLWPSLGGRTSAGNPADTRFFSWMLESTVHSVATGANPYVTHLINAPHGANLGWNTAAVPLGLLLAPVTVLWSPLAAANLGLTLGIATSAWSLALVLGRLPAGPRLRRGPTAAAGAVFGFSPAVLAHATGHLNYTFLALIPVILWLAARLAVGVACAGRGGLALGAVCGLQMLTNEELMLDTVVFALLVALIVVVVHPARVRERIWAVVFGGLIATGVLVVVAAPLLFVQFFGPLIPHGQVYDPDRFSADLAGLVRTPPNTLFAGPRALANIGRLQPGAGESSGFLGWPLIVVLVASAAVMRNRAIWLSTWAVAVATLMSLGRGLRFDGHLTAVQLPYGALQSLPLAESALPTRWSLFSALAVAVTLGLLLESLWSSRHLAAASLVLAAVLPLVPAEVVPSSVELR